MCSDLKLQSSLQRDERDVGRMELRTFRLNKLTMNWSETKITRMKDTVRLKDRMTWKVKLIRNKTQ